MAGCYLVFTQINVTSFGNSDTSLFELVEGSSCSTGGITIFFTYLAPANYSWTAPDGWLFAASNSGDDMCLDISPGGSTTHASAAFTYYYTATHP